MPCYSNLLGSVTPKIADKSQSYQFLTERHLQAMWLEQKYFKKLTTHAGEPIQVVSPGIWNADAGPDFLKAHLRIGSREYRGDIEIHLSAESWQQHGHHNDGRYDNVVLHVSLWKPKNETSIITKNGRVILQTYLEPNLTIPHSRIVQLIDLDLYPYKKFIGSGKCAHALFRSMPEKKIVTFFKSAATWRLERKVTFLKAHVEEGSLLMGAGVAMALGYKNNTEIFLKLFNWLKTIRQPTEEKLFILSLKSCGFFSEFFQKKWSDSEYYKHLLLLSQKESDDFPFFKPVLNQIRPFNHPIRRLVVLAKLLIDTKLPILFEEIETCWKTHWRICEAKTLLKNVRELLPSYTDSYWNSHYLFENEKKEEMLTLIGEDLKNNILINTFLPLLYEKVLLRKDSDEMAAFEAFYASFPAAKSSKTKYLVHRFFGDSNKGAILNSAETEQGAYQLHHDFCLHYEASCFGCPFVNRFNGL